MSEDAGRYVCLNCSGQMDGLKCKIRCPRCGYFESCSDLEPAPPISAAVPAAGPQALLAAVPDAGTRARSAAVPDAGPQALLAAVPEDGA